MEKEAFRSAPFIGRRGAAVVSVPYFTFPPYVLLVDLPSPDRIGLFPLRFAGFTLFSCALWFVRISCECRFCLFSSCGEGNNRSLRRRPTFAPSVIRSQAGISNDSKTCTAESCPRGHRNMVNLSFCKGLEVSDFGSAARNIPIRYSLDALYLSKGPTKQD